MSEEDKDMASTLAEKVDSVPSLPEISTRIVKLVNQEETTIEELGRAVRTDPSLSALILRYANSSYYGFSKEINNIQRAITVLGFNTVRSLALSYGVEKQYTAPEIPEFPREDFWDYSLAVAVASEIIAQELGYSAEKRHESFSAGHLHAVGKTIIDQHLHREFVKIHELTDEEGISMYEAEQEVLGITHCEIGGTVLAEWNLPEVLSQAARYYHAPDESEMEIVTIVHLGSILAKTSKLGYSGDYNLDYLQEEAIDELGLAEGTIENILREELPEEYENINRL